MGRELRRVTGTSFELLECSVYKVRSMVGLGPRANQTGPSKVSLRSSLMTNQIQFVSLAVDNFTQSVRMSATDLRQGAWRVFVASEVSELLSVLVSIRQSVSPDARGRTPPKLMLRYCG
jgi:hypothetical protein